MSELDQLDIISNEVYEREGYPHEAWTRLRRESPVHWFDQPRAQPPFWAVTKHADIIEISRKPGVFRIAPRLAVFPEVPPLEEGTPPPSRHLLNMDPPDHGLFRKIASPRFTPRAVRAREERIETIAHGVLDAAGGQHASEEADFVERIAAPFPLYVLAELLGAPSEDWPLLFRWTNETIGAADPEYQKEGETAEDTAERARLELFGYFGRLAEERNRAPRDDLVTLIARGRPKGAPIEPFELLSYYYLLVVAGNETTRNALSGGMRALAEHPGEWEKLRRDPSRVDAAAEEIVRWTTPVIQFARTAREDYSLRGVRIRAGQSVCLFYPSANRDEEVFADPFVFRVDRSPNPHLGFGVGEHYCLGAHMARLQLRVMLRALIERLEVFELRGESVRLRSSFVGGIKRLPLRYRLRPRPHRDRVAAGGAQKVAI